MGLTSPGHVHDSTHLAVRNALMQARRLNEEALRDSHVRPTPSRRLRILRHLLVRQAVGQKQGRRRCPRHAQGAYSYRTMRPYTASSLAFHRRDVLRLRVVRAAHGDADLLRLVQDTRPRTCTHHRVYVV